MEIDLALWGFILGALGTALSTILAGVQVIDRIRSKSEERESTAKGILQRIFGPIKTYHDSFSASSDNLHLPETNTFLREFEPFKNEILGAKGVLNKVAPKITSDLIELIDVIDKKSGGLWFSGLEIYQEPKVKSLVPALRKSIEKWLSDHA